MKDREQIRIHGRGGQGVVTAAEIIAIAAFKEGKNAQAFPHFGVERSGAPIVSYARLSKSPILTRERIYSPSILIILDYSLLQTESDIRSGIDKDTLIIINAPRGYRLNIKLKSLKIYFSPATEIALSIFNKNIVNTTILGTLAKHSDIISLPDLKKAIEEKFKDKGSEVIRNNILAIENAYHKKY